MYYHDVAVIGDSFVNRLKNDRSTDRKLDLSYEINVRWYTLGGLTISRMDPTLDSMARDFQQVAILQIGSNDLCQQASTAFLNNLCAWIIPKLQDIGCKVIVLCQLFHRQPGKYTTGIDLLTYNLRIDEVNAATASLKWHNIVFWHNIVYLFWDLARTTKYGAPMVCICPARDYHISATPSGAPFWPPRTPWTGTIQNA